MQEICEEQFTRALHLDALAVGGVGSRNGPEVLEVEAVARRESMNPDPADGEQPVLFQLVVIC